MEKKYINDINSNITKTKNEDTSQNNNHLLKQMSEPVCMNYVYMINFTFLSK